MEALQFVNSLQLALLLSGAYERREALLCGAHMLLLLLLRIFKLGRGIWS